MAKQAFYDLTRHLKYLR